MKRIFPIASYHPPTEEGNQPQHRDISLQPFVPEYHLTKLRSIEVRRALLLLGVYPSMKNLMRVVEVTDPATGTDRFYYDPDDDSGRRFLLSLEVGVRSVFRGGRKLEMYCAIINNPDPDETKVVRKSEGSYLSSKDRYHLQELTATMRLQGVELAVSAISSENLVVTVLSKHLRRGDADYVALKSEIRKGLKYLSREVHIHDLTLPPKPAIPKRFRAK